MIGVRSHDQIVTLPALREIFPRVINDMVCANRPRRVHIPGAAYGGDFSPERFGNLDCKCTHPTRRAIDKNLVAWLDPSLITKTQIGRAHGLNSSHLGISYAVFCLKKKKITNLPNTDTRSTQTHTQHHWPAPLAGSIRSSAFAGISH